MADAMMTHVERGIHALKDIHAQMDIVKMTGMEMGYLMMKKTLAMIVMGRKADAKEIHAMKRLRAQMA